MLYQRKEEDILNQLQKQITENKGIFFHLYCKFQKEVKILN